MNRLRRALYSRPATRFEALWPRSVPLRIAQYTVVRDRLTGEQRLFPDKSLRLAGHDLAKLWKVRVIPGASELLRKPRPPRRPR